MMMENNDEGKQLHVILSSTTIDDDGKQLRVIVSSTAICSLWFIGKVDKMSGASELPEYNCYCTSVNETLSEHYCVLLLPSCMLFCEI